MLVASPVCKHFLAAASYIGPEPTCLKVHRLPLRHRTRSHAPAPGSVDCHYAIGPDPMHLPQGLQIAVCHGTSRPTCLRVYRLCIPSRDQIPHASGCTHCTFRHGLGVRLLAAVDLDKPTINTLTLAPSLRSS